jgi:acetylornithine deacetylase
MPAGSEFWYIPLTMADRPARVSAAVDRGSERSVRRLQELVRVARAGEAATQALVAAALDDAGCRVETFRYAPRDLALAHQFVRDGEEAGERTAVVGCLGDAHAVRLLLFAHPDVEPVAGTERWRHPPFAGVIEDGRVRGWGVADDLAGVAIMVGALDALRDAGLTPRGGLIAASSPSKRDARGIVAVLGRGHRADAAVYLHPAESGHGLAEIKAATPGLLRFRVTVRGRPADTREPEQTPFAHRAVDPIEKVAVLAIALRACADRRAARVRHPAIEAAIGRATNLQLAYVHAGAPDRLGRASDTCVLAGSITFPPGESMESVQAEVAETLGAAAAGDPWLRGDPPTLDWLFGAAGAEVGRDHPLYRDLRGTIGAVTGREPVLNALHASSDIGHPILHAGIPTVGFGPRAGDLSQAGGHDEWVDVAEYLQAIAVTARLVADWCDAG